jgi:hypothetical protein
VDNKYIILNSGGFSRSFFDHMNDASTNQYEFLDRQQLSRVDQTQRKTLDIIVVADWSFEEIVSDLKQLDFCNFIKYGNYLLGDNSGIAPEGYALNAANTKQVAIRISDHLGYRKPYYAIVEAVKKANLQPILFSFSKLNDPLEKDNFFVQLKDGFQLYHYAKQTQLLIADANLLASPMQALTIPKLYIPHGFLGIYERNIELNISADLILENHSKKIFQPFSHAFLPSNFVFRFFRGLAEKDNKINNLSLIPGGYINLDMAMKSDTAEKQQRDAILYCPGAIPKNNLHADLPMSFPDQSQQILSSLLDNFPDEKVIFRHHPSAVYDSYQKSKIDEINEAFKHRINYIYDANPTHAESFSRAKLMISDSSTSSYTYALSQLRPVLYFLPHAPGLKISFNQVDYDSVKHKIGKLILNSIPELIAETKEALTNQEKYQRVLLEFRNEQFFNISQVAKYLQNTIEKLCNGEQSSDWEIV